MAKRNVGVSELDLCKVLGGKEAEILFNCSNWGEWGGAAINKHCQRHNGPED